MPRAAPGGILARMKLFLGVLALLSPLLAPSGAPAAPPFAGEPTRVTVLGTPHLSGLPPSVEIAFLAPLLDRLAGVKPDFIAVEGLPGEQCDHLRRHATLYPGVAASLERLAAAGLPLGVVTNKARAFSVRLLERLDVAHRFAAVVCGDDGWPKKPAAEIPPGARDVTGWVMSMTAQSGSLGVCRALLR